MGLSVCSYSQEFLIKESEQTLEGLDGSEHQRLTNIQAQEMYSDYYLMEYGSLIDSQNEGEITISLPGDDCEDLIFRAKSVDYTNEQDYTWYGELNSTAAEGDCLCHLGSITLISSEHGKIAHITIDNKAFEILQLSDDTFILGRLDDSKFTESECGMHNGTQAPPTTGHNDNIQSRSDGNCEVRCLVLFTNKARNAEGGTAAINNRAQLAVVQTNQALRNSDINAGDLTIRLVDVQSAYWFFEDEIFEDIKRLAIDPDINGKREILEADIVVLLTAGEYGSTFGIVHKIGPLKNSAFGIVQTGAATTGRFTFAHEVAHMFGARHNDDPEPGIPHGHSFRTGNFVPCIFGFKQRTIEHNLGFNGSRIQHYSNPDVRFHGRKTGKKRERDNARQIRNEACVVAQFEETIEPFVASITGDLYTCPCSGAFLNANIIGGTIGATYDYTWETSIDGISWNFLSNSSSAFVSPSSPPHQCPGEDRIFIRLKVISSDGNQYVTKRTVERVYNWPGQQFDCLDIRTTVSEVVDFSMSISPNPASDEAEVMLQIKESDIYSVYVYDVHGKVIKSILEDEELVPGKYRYRLNLETDGLFLIQSIDSKNKKHSAKFVKQ